MKPVWWILLILAIQAPLGFLNMDSHTHLLPPLFKRRVIWASLTHVLIHNLLQGPEPSRNWWLLSWSGVAGYNLLRRAILNFLYFAFSLFLDLKKASNHIFAFVCSLSNPIHNFLCLFAFYISYCHYICTMAFIYKCYCFGHTDKMLVCASACGCSRSLNISLSPWLCHLHMRSRVNLLDQLLMDQSWKSY